LSLLPCSDQAAAGVAKLPKFNTLWRPVGELALTAAAAALGGAGVAASAEVIRVVGTRAVTVVIIIIVWTWAGCVTSAVTKFVTVWFCVNARV